MSIRKLGRRVDWCRLHQNVVMVGDRATKRSDMVRKKAFARVLICL